MDLLERKITFSIREDAKEKIFVWKKKKTRANNTKRRGVEETRPEVPFRENPVPDRRHVMYHASNRPINAASHL